MLLNMALAYSKPDFFETLKTSWMNQIYWLDLLVVAGWYSALKMLLLSVSLHFSKCGFEIFKVFNVSRTETQMNANFKENVIL